MAYIQFDSLWHNLLSQKSRRKPNAHQWRSDRKLYGLSTEGALSAAAETNKAGLSIWTGCNLQATVLSKNNKNPNRYRTMYAVFCDRKEEAIPIAHMLIYIKISKQRTHNRGYL